MAAAAPFRVVLCSNAFKECLSARDACEAMKAGVLRCAPWAHCDVRPLADGGDSSLEVLVGQGGELCETAAAVSDPLGRPCRGVYGLVDGGRTAVVEMARVSGLALLTEAEKDPLATSTYGTGEVIRNVLDAHPAVAEVVLCVGGSATNDVGTGMAAALGYRFLGGGGAIARPTGGDLQRIAAVDASQVHPRVAAVKFRVACDVTNPLLGDKGAAVVFAPQKGAHTAAAVAELEAGAAHLAAVLARADTAAALQRAVGTPRELFEALGTAPGGGAAGGLGLGCRVFLNAQATPGFAVVSAAVGLEAALREAHLAFTGEGRLDAQTAAGKVPHGVSQLCAQHGVPLVALGGGVALDHSLQASAFSLCNRPMPLQEAMDPTHARTLLAAAACNAARLFLAGRAAGARL